MWIYWLISFVSALMFDGLVITIWFNRNVDILTNFICFSTDVWWLGYNDMVQEGVLKTYNDQTAPWSNMISRWGNFDVCNVQGGRLIMSTVYLYFILTPQSKGNYHMWTRWVFPWVCTLGIVISVQCVCLAPIIKSRRPGFLIPTSLSYIVDGLTFWSLPHFYILLTAWLSDPVNNI
jgi:hypothetical protein